MDLEMGQVVEVSKTLERRTVTVEGVMHRSWEEVEVGGRPGWVVGFRTLREGILHSNFRSVFVGEENEVGCVLVCFTPGSNAVRVPFDGWTDTEEEPYDDPTRPGYP